jgi:hypothetical protein
MTDVNDFHIDFTWTRRFEESDETQNSLGKVLTFSRVIFDFQDAGFFYHDPSFESSFWRPSVFVIIIHLQLHLRVSFAGFPIMGSCHDVKEIKGISVWYVSKAFAEDEFSFNSNGKSNDWFVDSCPLSCRWWLASIFGIGRSVTRNC